MDLTEFSSPLPKPWLNINANSVHVGPGGGGGSNPVSVSAYSQTSAVAVANASGNFSLSSGATHVGSLTMPPLPIGAVIRLRANIGFNQVPSASSTWFLRLDGVAVAQFNLVTGVGTTILGQGRIEGTFTILPGAICLPNLQGFVQSGVMLADDPSATGTPAYDNTISHTVDLAIGFGVANPSTNFSCTQFYIELLASN